MKIQVFTALSIVFAGLVGCSPVTSDAMLDVSQGMTKKEVLDALGRPESINADGNSETLQYKLCVSECWRVPGFRDDEYFYIELLDNKVSSFHRRGASDGAKPSQKAPPQIQMPQQQPIPQSSYQPVIRPSVTCTTYGNTTTCR